MRIGSHLLVIVATEFVHMPNGESRVGQRRVASCFGAGLHEEVLGLALGVHCKLVLAGGKTQLSPVGDLRYVGTPTRQTFEVRTDLGGVLVVATTPAH